MMLLACLLPICASATDVDDGTVKDLNEDIDDEYAKIESEKQNQKGNLPNISKSQDDVSGDEGSSEMVPNNMDRAAISCAPRPAISTGSGSQVSSSSNCLVSKETQEKLSTGIGPTGWTEAIATGSSRSRMSSSINRLVNKETNEDHPIGPRSEISTGSQSKKFSLSNQSVDNKETLEGISTGPLSPFSTAGNGSKISSATNRLVNEEIRDDLSAGPQSTISTGNRSKMTSSNNRSVNKEIHEDLSTGHRSAISIGNGSKMSVNEDTPEDLSTGPQSTSLSYSRSEMSSSNNPLVYETREDVVAESNGKGPLQTAVSTNQSHVADVADDGSWSDIWLGIGTSSSTTKKDDTVVASNLSNKNQQEGDAAYIAHSHSHNMEAEITKYQSNVADDRSGIWSEIWSEIWSGFGGTKNDAEAVSRDPSEIYCRTKSLIPVETETASNNWTIPEDVPDVGCDDNCEQSPGVKEDTVVLSDDKSKQPPGVDDRSEVEGRKVDEAVFDLVIAEKRTLAPKEKKSRSHAPTKYRRPRQVKLSKVFPTKSGKSGMTI